MTIRIHSPGAWKQVTATMALNFQREDPAPRVVQVRVNCPEKTRFDLLWKGGSTFVGVVEGFDVLEFVADNETVLQPSAMGPSGETEVWYLSTDGDDESYSTPELTSFTKVVQRRARNPELDRMMSKMQENLMRRLNRQLRDQQLADALLAAEAGLEVDESTGEVVSDGNNPPAAGKARSKSGKGAKATPEPEAEGVKPDGAAGE